MEKKNVAKSVRAKLLNIRDSVPGTEYMQILLRYIQERMLYRLSMSLYRDNFCLKGSALLLPTKSSRLVRRKTLISWATRSAETKKPFEKLSARSAQFSALKMA